MKVDRLTVLLCVISALLAANVYYTTKLIDTTRYYSGCDTSEIEKTLSHIDGMVWDIKNR